MHILINVYLRIRARHTTSIAQNACDVVRMYHLHFKWHAFVSLITCSHLSPLYFLRLWRQSATHLQQLWRQSTTHFQQLWRQSATHLQQLWRQSTTHLQQLWRQSTTHLQQLWRQSAIHLQQLWRHSTTHLQQLLTSIHVTYLQQLWHHLMTYSRNSDLSLRCLPPAALDLSPCYLPPAALTSVNDLFQKLWPQSALPTSSSSNLSPRYLSPAALTSVRVTYLQQLWLQSTIYYRSSDLNRYLPPAALTRVGYQSVTWKRPE